MNRGTLPNYTFKKNECIESRNGENCQLSAGKLQCQRLPDDRSVVLMNCQFGGSRRLNVLRAYGRLSQAHRERERENEGRSSVLGSGSQVAYLNVYCDLKDSCTRHDKSAAGSRGIFRCYTSDRAIRTAVSTQLCIRQDCPVDRCRQAMSSSVLPMNGRRP